MLPSGLLCYLCLTEAVIIILWAWNHESVLLLTKTNLKGVGVLL